MFNSGVAGRPRPAMMSFHVRRRSRHGRTLGRVHLQALDQPPPRACSVRRKTLQYLLTQQPCLRQRHDADGRCGQRAGASGGVLRVGPYSERALCKGNAAQSHKCKVRTA